jgi:hypothetical protein
MDVLELACECKCENFVSNIIVQNILNDIWSHKNETDSSIEPVTFFKVEFYFIFSSYFKTHKERELLKCQERYNSNNKYM